MVLHRNIVSLQMVSPQNGVTWVGPPPTPPSDATDQDFALGKELKPKVKSVNWETY